MVRGESASSLDQIVFFIIVVMSCCHSGRVVVRVVPLSRLGLGGVRKGFPRLVSRDAAFLKRGGLLKSVAHNYFIQLDYFKL